MQTVPVNETAEQTIARLQSENEHLRAKRVKAITFKVGKAGGCSVYGLGQRFPLTLYADGWEKLLDPQVIANLKAFLVENAAHLAAKE